MATNRLLDVLGLGLGGGLYVPNEFPNSVPSVFPICYPCFLQFYPMCFAKCSLNVSHSSNMYWFCS
jgi:hypothetical protein